MILVEGIPGSGKTTIAQKVAGWLRANGKTVNLYLEGQAHPADLGWIACVPVALYDNLLEKFASLREDIKRNTNFEGEYAFVAYTQISTENGDFYKEFGAYEVYEGRVSNEMFFQLHYDRWRTFGENAAKSDAINIFECSFMQNHVNELLLWRDISEEDIILHHNRLINSVKHLSPVLIYLSQPDIRETVSRIAKERVSPQGDRWIDRVIKYCEDSPFGKRHNIKGFDGSMEIFDIRRRLEMKIMTQLEIPYIVVESTDYNWDEVWAKIEIYLRAIYFIAVKEQNIS